MKFSLAVRQTLQKILVYLVPVLFLVFLSESGAETKSVPEPEYAKGRLLLKLKSTDGCLDCMSGDVSAKLTDKQQGSIDKLNRKYKVKSVKGLFVDRKGLSDKDAKAKFQGMVDKAKKKQSPAKQRLKSPPVSDLSGMFVLEMDPSVNLMDALNIRLIRMLNPFSLIMR
jgi:hypothetical protein